MDKVLSSDGTAARSPTNSASSMAKPLFGNVESSFAGAETPQELPEEPPSDNSGEKEISTARETPVTPTVPELKGPHATVAASVFDSLDDQNVKFRESDGSSLDSNTAELEEEREKARNAFLASAEDAGDGPAIDGSAFNEVLVALGATDREEANAKIGKNLEKAGGKIFLDDFVGWYPHWNRFQADEGSWKCESCMVRNTGDVTKCAACETAKPGHTATSSVNQAPAGVTAASAPSFGSGISGTPLFGQASTKLDPPASGSTSIFGAPTAAAAAPTFGSGTSMPVFGNFPGAEIGESGFTSVAVAPAIGSASTDFGFEEVTADASAPDGDDSTELALKEGKENFTTKKVRKCNGFDT
jgi:hypothetical protein